MGIWQRLSKTLILAAVCAAGPAHAESYEQFKSWCYDDASAKDKLAGCNAIIFANKESKEGMATAYYKRGNAYRDLGQDERAIEDFDRAILLEPEYVSALHNRAHLYDQMGQYERALVDYSRAINAWPEFGLV